MKFEEVVPVFRIFSLPIALEFYCGYLGFREDWRADTGGKSPFLLQVSRDTVRLRLSEYHSDGSTGAAIFIQMEGVVDFYAELAAKQDASMRPELYDGALGAKQVTVTDPFGNRIHFRENR